MADATGILFANEAFYAAFANADVDAMDALWAVDVDVVCVHPGGAPINDRAAVMSSWRDILAHVSSTDMKFLHAEARVIGGLGIVSCYEKIGGGLLAATNGFVERGGRWRMVIHHAGGCAEPPQILGVDGGDDDQGSARIH